MQTLQETRSIHDSMNITKIELRIRYLHFIINIIIYYKYLKYKKNIFNLGIKTVFYLKYNRINGYLKQDQMDK